MNSRLQTHLTRLAFALAVLCSPSLKAATFNFHVDIDTTALLSASSSGPFSLDFQLNQGNGTLTNSVTISNFTFDNGSATGSPTIYSGNPTGNLTTSVSLNDSTNSTNEFAQGFSSGTTGIHFDVVTSQSSPGTTPDGFLVQILGGDTFAIATNDPTDGTSLLALNITANNSLADVSTFSSTSPAGVTASAIPEPSTTASLFGGAAVMLVGLRRFTQKRKVA